MNHKTVTALEAWSLRRYAGKPLAECERLYRLESDSGRCPDARVTWETDRRIKREIDRVPPTLDEAVQAKCKREGVSLRALTLRLWKDWVDGKG